ncbi:uncharacterized protein LOC116240261 [Phasianus colchicus]|uniref:uncharacterized protein LOC116240261 n=1 Tax=Phasianus colchicus TaxID=9054 RepID=UPI00129D3BB3|nr:uncharacterized protein LOC116240261 [Phasianus colchicus]
MSLSALPSASSSAVLASSRALRALVQLAEALGKPEALAAEVAKAQEAAAEAEAALEGLEAALAAALSHSAQLPAARGLEAQGIYRALRDMAAAHARELEREVGRNLRRRRLLGVLRNVAVGLLLLCAPLLSLDVVREALGVTQESHVVPCLATVTAVCQVALWSAERSEGHLVEAAEQQRRQAVRYGRMAQNAANAAAEATEAAGAIGAANAVRETLEEVSNQLRLLANAVARDVEAAHGFTGSARALGNAVTALGAVLKDEEGTQRLARALQGLSGEE